MSQKKSQSLSTLSSSAMGLLLGSALGEAALSAYQWAELLKVRAGGVATCSLNATVNCATVWNSPLAHTLHSWLGIPIAGLGLVWGLWSFFVAVGLKWGTRHQKTRQTFIWAVRWASAAGLGACVVFALGSVWAKAVCLTCLGTYVLVFGYVFAAFRLLPAVDATQGVGWKQGLGPTLVAVLPLFLAVRFFGPHTPLGNDEVLKQVPLASTSQSPNELGQGFATAEEQTLSQFIEGLSWAEKQALSDSLEGFRQAQPQEVSGFPVRFFTGSELAPIHFVEFTDILCSHCGALMRTMKELRRAVPSQLLSIEARYYPLDSECNPTISRTDGSGTRCLGAKVQICLEGTPDFWPLREKLFEEQNTLNRERILEIASQGSMSKEKLLSCIASPETAKKLQDDIQYALRYQIQGTPLVLVNGKQGSPMGAFLYAMAMSRADASSKVFASLPKPSLVQDAHR